MDNRKGLFIGFNKDEEKLLVWLLADAEKNKISINQEIKNKLKSLFFQSEKIKIDHGEA